MEKESQEVTLIDLLYTSCKAIGKFIKKIWAALLQLVRFSFQNALIVGVFVILAFVAGLIAIRPSHTVYRGEATVLVVEEARSAVLDQIQILNSHCLTNRIVADLNLTDSIGLRIDRFEVFDVIDFLNDSTPDIIDFAQKGTFLNDTLNVIMRDRFFLRIVTKGVADFGPIQAGLQNYFEQEPRVSLAALQGKRNLESRLKVYGKEIQRLDSLSDFSYFSSLKPLELVSGKGVVFAQKEQELFYENILKLAEKRNFIETFLASRPHVINFQNDIRLSATHPLLRLFWWVLGGYVLGLLVAWSIVRRQELGKFFKYKKQ